MGGPGSAQKPLPPPPVRTTPSVGLCPSSKPCDPGSPPGGRGGRSWARGPSTGLKGGLQLGILLLGESRATFSGLAWLRSRRGRANYNLEKAAGPELMFRFSPSTHNCPHRLENHKSLCTRPCSPGNVLFPWGTFSSRGERLAQAPPALGNRSLLPAPLFRGLPRPPHVCCSQSHSWLLPPRRFGYLLTCPPTH